MARLSVRCDEVVVIRLPKSMLDRLKDVADGKRWNVSKLIRKVLDEYLRSGNI